jgi:transcriptional regulator with XRE-family HTH domain
MSPAFFRIKELREARGMTRAQLAAAVGVRQATINDLENGHTREDTLALIDRLCEALSVSPGELIVRTEAPHRPKGRGTRPT